MPITTVHRIGILLRKLQPKVPCDLETICLKCLRKEPARRYESASALADDLRRFGEGRPIVARPVGRLERAAKWVRRNPALAGMTAVVVLAASVGALPEATDYISLFDADVTALLRAAAK